MKLRYLAMALLATTALWSCGDDYDDTELRNEIGDLKSRVEKLEEWSTKTNGEISALQGAITALESKDYVTGVSPVIEGGQEVGYTLTFGKGEPITIYHGKDGEKGKDGVTPVIGVAQENGIYYWTVQVGEAAATWMLDSDGKKIPTTGANGTVGKPGTTPQISVDTFTDNKVYWKINGEWLLDASGNKVRATGDKGDKGENGTNGAPGDAVFATNGVELFDDYVKFTLAGTPATSFTLPRSSDVKIFDEFTEFEVSDAVKELVLSLNVKEGEYGAIKAELTNSIGMTTAIVKAATRAATTTWGVSLTNPTFNDDKSIKNNAKVTFDLPAGMDEGESALLKITVIDKSGQEHSSVRIIVYTKSVTPPVTTVFKVGDYYPAGATKETAVGVVFWIDETDASYDATAKTSIKGKIVSMDEATGKSWADACAWKSTNTLSEGMIWYCPSKDELQHLFCSYNGIAPITWESGPCPSTLDATKRADFNNKLTTPLTASAYWSSTESDDDKACRTLFGNGYTGFAGKDNNSAVRVVATFSEATPPASEGFIKVNGLKVAVGNLVYNATTKKVEIGAATDGGLFFQFGSLVGWSDKEPLEIVVKPATCNVTAWSSSWTGASNPSTNPDTKNEVAGTGDPCRYYLGGTWRLPKVTENVALLNDCSSWADSGGWSWTDSPASATHTDNLKIAASGYRDNEDGSLGYVGSNGRFWSATSGGDGFGYYLSFTSSYLRPVTNGMRAYGFAVRCIKD